MDYDNNNNSIVAQELEDSSLVITALEKDDIENTIKTISEELSRIDAISQQYNAPSLRALVHWMTLNSEYDVSTKDQVKQLLNQDCFTNWLDTLSGLLRDHNQNQLPQLHKSLTAPDWLIPPSAPLLKNLAVWIDSCKKEDSENTEVEAKEEISATSTSDNFADKEEQVSETKGDKSYSPIITEEEEEPESHHVFEEVDTTVLEKDYDDSADEALVELKELADTKNEVLISDKTSLLVSNEETNEATLIDTEADDIVPVESYSKQTSSINQNTVDEEYDINQDFSEEIDDIVLSLFTLSSQETEHSKSIKKYQKELNRITQLADLTSNSSIADVTEWCQRNIEILVENKTETNDLFLSSGQAWAWIEHLNHCFIDASNAEAATSLVHCLKSEEWPEPIDKTLIESLFENLSISLHQNYETNSSISDDNSKKQDEETHDNIDVEISDEIIEKIEQNNKPNVDETSGLQIHWDEDTHPELLTVFLDETPKQIAELESLINKMIAKESSSEDRRTASRMAHTVKGGSAIVGVTALSEMSYQLEQILDYSVENELPSNLLELLPLSVNCLKNTFEAMQSQQAEPREFLTLLNALKQYAESLDSDDSISLELSDSITLPDFITNSDNSAHVNETDTSDLHSTEEKESTSELEPVHIEDIKNNEIQDAPLEKLEDTSTESSLSQEIDNIVMSLISISSIDDNGFSSYKAELQRFSVLCELSGYPKLIKLSEWCQSNLNHLNNNTIDDATAELVKSGQAWSWLELLNTCLIDSEEISHLSLLSEELTRSEWPIPLEIDVLQEVLLSLREQEDSETRIKGSDSDIEQNFEKENVDTWNHVSQGSEDNDSFQEIIEESSEINQDSDEIISWDKDVHPELLSIYFQETPDQITDLASLLHKIVDGKADIEDHKHAARIAHTIKGASGVVGIDSLVNLTHKLEDILDYSVDNELPSQTAELLSESSDCLESLFETIQLKQQEPEELLSVVKRLSDLINSLDDLKEGSSVEDRPEIALTDSEDLSELYETMNNLENESKETITDNFNEPENNKSPSNLTETHIRVPVNVIDRLLNLAGELVTTSTQVSDHLDKTIQTSKTIKTQDSRVHKMLGELSKTISQQEQDQSKMFSNLKSSDFDDLEMDTYNELHSVAGLLTESILDSEAIDDNLNKQLNELNTDLRLLTKLNRELSDVILNSRMVSINTLVPRLERIVRQTCRKTGKQANLTISGNDINIDTDILNGLIDPLLHLLRNAVDHGIEDTKTRKAHKKDDTGTINLDFVREGNNIIMKLEDDGAGIDPDFVYKRAVKKGLIRKNAKLSTSEILKLILLPGFSTEENVTDISGRGVGMDIVNSAIENLKGSLRINSTINKGTEFEFRIPLTLVTSTTLLVSVAGNPVAIPSDNIEQLFYLSPNEAINNKGVYYIKHQERPLPIISLAALLKWPSETVDYTKSHTLLIIKSESKRYAVHFDEILNSREVVIKQLNPWVNASKGIIGACHLNDGAVAPVLNLPHIITNVSADIYQQNTNTDTVNNVTQITKPVETDNKRNKTILVVDDSLSNRKALSLIIDQTDYDVITAVDGLDALQMMNESEIDLVFTDLEMPRMNGLEFTQAVRAWDKKQETPIVMITSRSTNKHRELATKAGVNDYLTKPVVTDTMLGTINTWLKVKATA